MMISSSSDTLQSKEMFSSYPSARLYRWKKRLPMLSLNVRLIVVYTFKNKVLLTNLTELQEVYLFLLKMKRWQEWRFSTPSIVNPFFQEVK